MMKKVTGFLWQALGVAIAAMMLIALVLFLIWAIKTLILAVF